MSDKPARAYVSHDLCVGVGMCAALAPDAFRLDRSGRSTFNSGSAASAEALQEAADGCPMSAITVLAAKP